MTWHNEQMLFVTIAIGAVLCALSFWAGIRYTSRTLLPVILARMTPEELAEVAKKAARERPPA